MIRTAIIAGALLIGASPALATPPVDSTREVRIPRIQNFIEWVADGKQGVFIRGDTGKWYYARTQVECARLRPATSISFLGARHGNLDRFGAIRVEGWRCPLDSVTESAPPPGHPRP